MGFTIPNAPTASFVDQAEPDSVDFSALGDRSTGVISGCAVTATATPDQNVSVAAGEVVSGGAFKTVGAATLAMGLSDASSPRFDLVVIDASGTVTKRTGTASSNPVFPSLTDGDVFLAAVYRRNSGGTGTSIEATDIIDKRVTTPSSIVRTGAGSPATSLGNVGDVYINTVVSSTAGQSQVWIKTTASLWENLGEYTVPQASTNTPSTLVLRDASGNFSAGTITATLNGNALTATTATNATRADSAAVVDNGVYNNNPTKYNISISGKADTAGAADTATTAQSAGALASARTIALGGILQGSVSTNLSSNATISAAFASNTKPVTASVIDYDNTVPRITVSTNAASGAAKNGDIWIQVV